MASATDGRKERKSIATQLVGFVTKRGRVVLRFLHDLAHGRASQALGVCVSKRRENVRSGDILEVVRGCGHRTGKGCCVVSLGTRYCRLQGRSDRRLWGA